MTIIEKEREHHDKSLEASAELAAKAELISLERGWSYKKAAEYVRVHDSRLAEYEKCGYISEQPSRNYTYTSHEASKLIADRAKEIQKEE